MLRVGGQGGGGGHMCMWHGGGACVYVQCVGVYITQAAPPPLTHITPITLPPNHLYTCCSWVRSDKAVRAS